MTKYNAVTPRPKYNDPEGVWWHKVGNAVMNDRGQISIYLDSVPVPDPKRENKIVIMLFEVKDDADQSDRTTGKSSTKPSTRTKARPSGIGDMDDEIPF